MKNLPYIKTAALLAAVLTVLLGYRLLDALRQRKLALAATAPAKPKSGA